ncbi:MAG: hypothetical protein IJB56_05390 [Alistipes sp.]|nr:hypothetical protein [Alistipes sp.]
MVTKRFIYSLIATLLVLSAAATAIADSQEPRFLDLEENSEYMELKRRNDALIEREDSIKGLIDIAREEFSFQRDSLVADTTINVNEALDRFASHIIELEQMLFDIRQERGDVITAINNIEQQYILEHMYAEAADSESIEEARLESDTIREEVVIEPAGYRELMRNDIITELLSEADYAELRTAQEEDASMDSLANSYVDTYNTLTSIAGKYKAATTEEEAEELFVQFHTLQNKAKSINSEIDRRWNHILDTKYYAYGYVLEHRLRYDLLDSSSAEFSNMQQQCSANDGIHASDALMHYAIGRPTLLDFEIDVAREFEIKEALDSLRSHRDSLNIVDYKLKPISIERRLFIDYNPITIGRTNYYNSSNPLPKLKVYERGTIYRILLGTFRNKQPMTLFKGVQPLYIAEEDGSYAYYAGGFASRSEADEAQLFLKEKGFKQPEVCRWKEGVMVNLDAMSDDDTDAELTPVGSRYIVVIECDSISQEMRAAITTTAPEKRISRIGENFAVGTFAERSEADILISTLMERHPEVVVELKELDL